MKIILTLMFAFLVLMASATNAKSGKLAEALYFEAATEPRRCQIMVANVIMNRVEDRRWPDNIYDVITQPWQFSYLNDGKPKRIKYNETYIELRKISNDVISGKLKDLTGGANHYINHKIATASHKWFTSMELTAKCGDHHFYKG